VEFVTGIRLMGNLADFSVMTHYCDRRWLVHPSPRLLPPPAGRRRDMLAPTNTARAVLVISNRLLFGAAESESNQAAARCESRFIAMMQCRSS